MVDKLCYVNIFGHNDNKDKVINYILSYDIHIDNVNNESKYTTYLNILNKYAKKSATKVIPLKDAISLADDLSKQPIVTTKEDEILQSYLNVGITQEYLLKFNFIKHTIGKLPTIAYKNLLNVVENIQVIIIEVRKDTNFNYIAYATTKANKQDIDKIFKKFGFIEISNFIQKLQNKVGEKEVPIIPKDVNITNESIDEAYNTIYLHNKREIVNNVSQKTKKHFIYSGYMTYLQASFIEKELKNDKDIIITIEDLPYDNNNEIPTKLKNNILFAPFEIFVRAYSMPRYNEIDPTPIIAILYTLLFGIMFGDIGQGAIICLMGMLFKKPIRNIAITVGTSSMFFGFMYGSIFGFEHILPALWLSPIHNIQTIIFIAVLIGICSVILGILLNIINRVKQKHYNGLVFGPNSISGLLFYLSIVGIVANIVFGYGIVLQSLSGILLLLPILPMIISILYEALVSKNGLFTTAIHTFENMLSYATNTLSFIRIGAIVLSHSAMMGAVFLFSRNLNLVGSMLVVGIGNVIVMSLEILVVSIQALRLNYYEMFSRFYTGGGKEFKAIKYIK